MSSVYFQMTLVSVLVFIGCQARDATMNQGTVVAVSGSVAEKLSQHRDELYNGIFEQDAEFTARLTEICQSLAIGQWKTTDSVVMGQIDDEETLIRLTSGTAGDTVFFTIVGEIPQTDRDVILLVHLYRDGEKVIAKISRER